MVAIRRLNSEVEGARPSEAVLDIWFPNQAKSNGRSLIVNLGIPDASHNPFVCIAAFCLLHRNINETIRLSNSKKAAGKPAASKRSQDFAAYSAATLRGGSSAPESWISAT